MSQPTAITTSDAITSEYVLYVHTETPSERMMRLSNVAADAFLFRALYRGEAVEELAEMADVLAGASRVYSCMGSLT